MISNESSLYFIQSLIPKSHIEATDFINENPSFDGRKIRIAIWDTGVDPAAEGLQITTENKPKLIHMCDTSGSGDVSMCMDIVLSENRIIKLSNNREIIIPKSWNVKDNLIKVGRKLASDIFPAPILTKLSKDYKESVWKKELNRLHSKFNEEKQKVKQLGAIEQTEPNLLLECLEIMDKAFEYPTPFFDCLVFHDEEDWIACIDTSPLNPELSLDDIPLLYSYNKNRQYSNFGGKTNLNFGVNIYDEGSLLEICSCSGSHATHVASIAAGYFPSKPECNGIAPGAEIVSIKISDTRLGSMETGMSLAFAAKVTIDLKCDIVNLSFGESSIQANCGRVCQLMQDLVSKHGIIFCSSSGNSGPALSTVGSPGGTTDTLFGISPLVFPDMIESNYSLPIDTLEDMSPQVYTWASRGPSLDGGLGIHVAAPGAAITSVAAWQNRNIGFMNGSSMSSPNGCGGITLLLSAARQLNKLISPWLLCLATMNTAKLIEGVSRLSQGNGLLQVNSAFSYLQKYWLIYDQQTDKIQEGVTFKTESLPFRINLDDENKDDLSNTQYITKNNSSVSLGRNVHERYSQTHLHLFRIKCTLFNGNRGIFLREPYETTQLKQFNINIVPDFDKEKLDLCHQLNIQLYLHVVCKASWVTCPRFFILYNQERSIPVKVDPRELNRNLPEYQKPDNDITSDCGVYFTEIELHCLEYSHLGALARFPITVYKSESITELKWSKRMVFTKDKKTIRHFLATPSGADSMLMQITPISTVDGNGRFDIRINQGQPNCSTLSGELSKSLSLDKKSNSSVIDPIAYMLSGSLSSNVEVTFSQYWSASSPAELEYSIDFHGLRLSSDTVKMTSADNHYRLLIESHLQMEEVSPSISMTHLVQPLRPLKEEITYVHKSMADEKPLINLELLYSFNNVKLSDVGVFCPALGNLLYENDFYSQIYQIYDCNNRIVGTGDYKPEIYFFKLDKGEFKIRLQIRHGSITQLERLKDQPILIYFKNAPSLTFEFSKSLVDINNNKTLSNGKMNYTIAKGEKTVLYITSNILKVLKQFNVGSYLVGNLSLYKNEYLKKAVTYPVQFTFTSNVVPISTKGDSIPNLKLSSKFCTDMCKSLNYEFVETTLNLNGESENNAINLDASKEGIIEITDDLINLARTHSNFQEGLVKNLLPWINEFHIKSEREILGSIITKINKEENAELLLAQLKACHKYSRKPENNAERWEKISNLSNDLIKLWDTKELAEFLGAKHPDASISLKKEQKTKLEKSKQYLIEVLCIYGLSLCEKMEICYKDQIDDRSHSNINSTKDKLDQVYCQLCRFVSPWDNNISCLPFFVMYAYTLKYNGQLLKLLLKCYEDQSSIYLLNLIQKVLLKMEWKVFADHYQKLLFFKHPSNNLSHESQKKDL